MNLQDLKKEMPFKWRVQSTNQWGCTCVAYIDARDVQDLLDEVVGAAKWQTRYSEHKGNLFCEIGILVTQRHNGDPVESWVWKSDCVTESQVEKQKGEASDAFKRAAVMWGIGRFLYSLGIIKIKEVIKDGKDRNGKDKYAPAFGGNKIWDINEYCNDIHSGKKQLPKKSYKKAEPVVKKVEPKKEDRKPAFKEGGWAYLTGGKATQEHIQKALNVNRMTPGERKILQALIK